MSHNQTNTKQSSSQPFRHVSSIHYNLTNNEECHTKCVSTATAHTHEPPGRTYVSSYYIAIGEKDFLFLIYFSVETFAILNITIFFLLLHVF